jgi:hypothetical protein
VIPKGMAGKVLNVEEAPDGEEILTVLFDNGEVVVCRESDLALEEPREG